MILDPVLSNTQVVLDTDRSRGYSKVKLFCTPTAAVVPRYVPAENRYGVATTIINMGSDPLVIRQGDIIAEARLCGDIEALHDASREEQAFKACALALEARLPGKVGDSGQANQVATGKLHQHLAGIPTSKASVDGLPVEHHEHGVTGTQSAPKVDESYPKFKAWCKEAKSKLRFGADRKLNRQALKLLYCYKEIFADNSIAHSPISGVQFSIDLVVGKAVHPRKERLRRCSPKELQAMYDETEKMLGNGIIRPSISRLGR